MPLCNTILREAEFDVPFNRHYAETMFSTMLT